MIVYICHCFSTHGAHAQVLEAAVQLAAKDASNEAAFQILTESTFFNNC